MQLSEIECRILTILQNKQDDEHIYLRGHSELKGFSREELAQVTQDLTERGYLRLYHAGQLIEVDNNFVNYFYELTETGRQTLCQGAS